MRVGTRRVLSMAGVVAVAAAALPVSAFAQNVDAGKNTCTPAQAAFGQCNLTSTNTGATGGNAVVTTGYQNLYAVNLASSGAAHLKIWFFPNFASATPFAGAIDIGPDKPTSPGIINPWPTPPGVPVQTSLLPSLGTSPWSFLGTYLPGAELVFGAASSSLTPAQFTSSNIFFSGFGGRNASGQTYWYNWGTASDIYRDRGISAAPSSVPKLVVNDGGYLLFGVNDEGSVCAAPAVSLSKNDCDYNDAVIAIGAVAVPEPASVALLGTGLFGLAGAGYFRRKRRSA